MRKIFFLIALTFAAYFTASAQPAPKATPALKKILELKMPKTVDDDKPGTRGAGVAWHPLYKQYYAVFAGNEGFPLAVFNQKGDRQSGDNLEAMTDCRGLWYNAATKKICGNGYDEFGWFSYSLDTKGMPKDIITIAKGMKQPDAQSVGVYNNLTKQVIFLYGSRLHFYNDKQKHVDSSIIHFGRKKAEGPSEDEDVEITPEDYNTTPAFTGIPGQELAFINTYNKQIELYNIKTGYITNTRSLPSDVVTEQVFNFAYANGMYWLFDIEERTWKGYR